MDAAPAGRALRVVALSDPHGRLPERVPECDLLLVAGDLCPFEDESLEFQRRWVETTLAPWLEAQPAGGVVAVAGNHDFAFAADPALPRTLPWRYLDGEQTSVDGLRVWGSPLTPTFGDWAFQAPDAELAATWAAIPDEVDVLLVHGPPHGLGDRTVAGGAAGSRTLLARIGELAALRLVVFGHIHEGRGGGATATGAAWRNVSLVDVRFRPVHAPVELEL